MRFGSLREILGLLSKGERRRGFLVLVMTIAMAFIETISVAAVMPFLAVLGNPAVVESNAQLSWLRQTGGFASTHSFLFALGIAAFAIVIGASLFRALAQYVMFRFINMRRHTIGARLLQSYLRQPYEFFLRRNPAELSKIILSEVEQLIQNIYRPGLQMIAYGVAALVLAGFLIVLDAKLALFVAGVLLGVYGLVYFAVRPVLGRMGQDRLQANQGRFAAVSEVLGGIKALKLSGREAAYLERFMVSSQAFAHYQSVAETLSTVPKFFIEAVGVGGILLLALALMNTRQDLGHVLPLLGLYVFAGYRLLPAAQNVYAGFARLRFGVSNVGDLYQELCPVGAARPDAAAVEPMNLRREIVLEKVSYSYPGSDRVALCEISLTIPARTSAAFVGATGAGKTTVVDLIVGLFSPQSGRILVDGRQLDANCLRSWQNALGYVPQDIYLADVSVIENIAFGVNPAQIDRQAARAAAQAARIHEFIENELPDDYDTLVGDRGVRLSGGQRQRIGIARALYHDPQVLIFDEATSALDPATEQAIVEVLAELENNKTLIIIAHRLSSVERCKRVFLLEQGALVDQGSYWELMQSSARFRRLAGK